MKRVLTYGTFDLLHDGHRRILARAAALGDYLIVGVTGQSYDLRRGKLNVTESLAQRIENVRATGLADEIIVEERDGQKIEDIQRLKVDLFAIGSDWVGKFDYLSDYCEVVYLDRTRGISSTQLRNEQGIVRLGIVGGGRIAHRFLLESKYVSGVSVQGVYTPGGTTAREFAATHELEFAESDYERMLDRVDAVYIASPHGFHYEQSKVALERGKHVLCEKPIAVDPTQARELYALAASWGLVFVEAIKTAYAPGFINLVALARSGVVGSIRAVDATFTKLVEGTPRELQASALGGSLTELGSYPLVAIVKLLGTAPTRTRFESLPHAGGEVDAFTRISLRYPGAVASATVGLGVKSEGSLTISGTDGYIYVPAPWWKTDYFEVRREDPRLNQRHSFSFDGDGLRYELNEFLQLIRRQGSASHLLTARESVFIAEVLRDGLAAREF